MNDRRRAACFVFGVLFLATLSVVGGSAGRAAEAWRRPPSNVRWDIWLSRVPRVQDVPGVGVIDLDLWDTPVARIAEFKRRDVYVICYFSAGSFEAWRPDADRFERSDLGHPLAGWEGERWLDVRSANVRSIMAARIERAASKGCDAVDPDNVDGYANRNGLGLTAADQLAFNRFLARSAHQKGLAVGLKNDLDQVEQLVGVFDFAVNEQCFKYRECERLRPFVAAKKPVFHIEYGGRQQARRVCPQANALGFASVVKRLNLGAATESCRDYRARP